MRRQIGDFAWVLMLGIGAVLIAVLLDHPAHEAKALAWAGLIGMALARMAGHAR